MTAPNPDQPAVTPEPEPTETAFVAPDDVERAKIRGREIVPPAFRSLLDAPATDEPAGG